MSNNNSDNNLNEKKQTPQDADQDIITLKKENFSYKVNPLPGQVKPRDIMGQIRAPRQASKRMMYIMFLLGSATLFLLAFLALYGGDDLLKIYGISRFDGFQTYWNIVTAYSRFYGLAAVMSFFIMAVVNLFWIIINILIEYLANHQEWIPPRKIVVSQSSNTEEEEKPTNLFARFESSYDMESFAQKLEEQGEQKKLDDKEDEQEYEAILENSALSPLAFLWIPVKKTYRFFARIPQKLSNVWFLIMVRFEKWVFYTKEILKNIWEVILYYLNPFNLIEEMIDIGITILVRVLYPAILTPLIFFLPIRYNFILENIFHVILYFILIGGLRVGVVFFSIYIRYLRNTTYSEVV
jgi:hypothetical protein